MTDTHGTSDQQVLVFDSAKFKPSVREWAGTRRVQELNLFGRRRLPVLFSAEAAECGLCCMAMIARYWGHDVDLNGLRQRFSFSISGATLRAIMDIADKLDFATRALRVELEALDQVSLPAILHWNLNHFVVLKAIDSRKAIIHDPSCGERSLTIREVSRCFTGVVLEISPTPTFASQTARRPTNLRSLWSNARGFWSAFVQVLLLSAALQVLVLAAPLQLQLVVDEAVFRADGSLLTVLALGFGALVIIQAMIEALRAWTIRYFGALLSFQMLGNLVRHMLRLSAGYFEKRHIGDILSRLNSATPIQEALTRGLVTALIDGVMAITTGAILFVYSPSLAGIVVATVALNFVVAGAMFPIMRRRTEQEIHASARERSHLIETARASVTIKLMGRETEREGIWRNLYADVVNASFSVGKYQIGLAFAQSAITGVQTVLVIYVAARMIVDGAGFSVGMLIAFLSFRQTFTDRAIALVNQTLQFRLLELHLERLGDIVQATPEPAPMAGSPINPDSLIRLRDVSFRYGDGDPLVLNHVSLDIVPGEYLAITGPSGGGKSTLLKLLLGLYPPTDGAIEIDGRAASQDIVRAWRAQAGVVVQDDRLLSGTLAENIAFFDPGLDMQRIHAAAEAAQVHEEIMRMPMRYMSLVGDMGSSLSRGQRQRVLIARALYREPKLLFLDEGTANLDEDNERLIADLVAKLAITRVIVAHRPALIERADRVVYVDRGRVLIKPARRHSEAS